MVLARVILLDVNNVYISGLNNGWSPRDYIDAIKRGDHLVVSTSTASGKSMIYNVSVIEIVVS
jgi:uncharacterized protein (UPF0276 family)